LSPGQAPLSFVVWQESRVSYLFLVFSFSNLLSRSLVISYI